VADLARYVSLLRCRGVRIHQGWRIVSAEGVDRVSSVLIEPTSGCQRQVRLRVDAVCVGYGFRPNTELLRVMGCECTVDALTGEILPLVDSFGRTSIPSVFVAGEVVGIAGCQAALVRGRLAAYAMLRDFGFKPARAEVAYAMWSAQRFANFA